MGGHSNVSMPSVILNCTMTFRQRRGCGRPAQKTARCSAWERSNPQSRGIGDTMSPFSNCHRCTLNFGTWWAEVPPHACSSTPEVGAVFPLSVSFRRLNTCIDQSARYGCICRTSSARAMSNDPRMPRDCRPFEALDPYTRGVWAVYLRDQKMTETAKRRHGSRSRVRLHCAGRTSEPHRCFRGVEKWQTQGPTRRRFLNLAMLHNKRQGFPSGTTRTGDNVSPVLLIALLARPTRTPDFRLAIPPRRTIRVECNWQHYPRFPMNTTYADQVSAQVAHLLADPSLAEWSDLLLLER